MCGELDRNSIIPANKRWVRVRLDCAGKEEWNNGKSTWKQFPTVEPVYVESDLNGINKGDAVVCEASLWFCPLFQSCTRGARVTEVCPEGRLSLIDKILARQPVIGRMQPIMVGENS